MNKIIDVIKKMIITSGKISNIKKIGQIFYFSYKGYIWSIKQPSNGTGISLAFYPLAKNISEITNQTDYITYNADTFGFENIFNQLYDVIKEKYYDLEKVFDNILKK